MKSAFKGFDISWSRAIEIIQAKIPNLSPNEQAKRKILLAAVNNIIEFAVGEEYHMIQDMQDVLDGFDENEDELTEDELEELQDLLATYNKRYAKVENEDIEYSMAMALLLLGVGDSELLIYKTQDDERVRPWHRQWEGYTAPKSRFPGWLIPPIEHQCRCFLVEDDMYLVANETFIPEHKGDPEMPAEMNPVFKESVALGGRIFSEAHSYFQCDSKDVAKIKAIIKRIKKDIYGG